MKKIIFILIMLISIQGYSKDNIPGFLELNLNYGRYYDFYGSQNHYFGSTFIDIKYGKEWSWGKFYGFANWNTFFQYTDHLGQNFPYRDLYGTGLNLQISIFYFEYEHRCSHAVFTENEGKNKLYGGTNFILFEGMPTISYDMFKIGLKIKID